MIRFTVINKARRTLHTEEGTELRLAEPGVILVDLAQGEVGRVSREGDRLLIRLVDGKQLVVHAFFDEQGARGELIFDDHGPFLSPPAYSPDAPLEGAHLFQHSSSALWAAHLVERLQAPRQAGVERGMEAGPPSPQPGRDEARPDKLGSTPAPLPAPSLVVQADGDGRVVASGHTAAGARVTVTFPDGSQQVVTADPSGHYSAQSASQHVGSGPVTAWAASPAGQVSPQASATYTDQLPPEPPRLSLTSHPDGSLSVEGEAEPGSLVQVHFPGGQGVWVQADRQGHFIAHVGSAQPPGPVTATATDAAGNISPPGEASFAPPLPPPPSLQAFDDVGSAQGWVAEGGITDDTRPLLSGHTAPHGTVQLTIDGAPPIVLTADERGHWQYTPTLGHGAHAVSVVAIDVHGQTSQATPLQFSVNTLTAPSLHLLDDRMPQVGELADGALTNDATLSVHGSGHPGATLHITVNGQQVATAVVDGHGRWSASLPAQPDGPCEVLVWQTLSGLQSPHQASTVWIDTTPPSTWVQILHAVDNAGPQVGTVADGGTSNDTSPEIAGSLGHGLGPGEQVLIYRDGVLVGQAAVVGTSWSFLDSGLANGSSYHYTAQVVDAAGNVGSTSSPLTLTVDTSAPGQTVAITSYTDDVTAATGGFAGGTSTNDTSPTLNGTLSAALAGGEVVNVYRDGVLVGIATVTGTSWTFTDSGLANGSTYSYTAQVVDAAGNVGSTSSPLTLTVDTLAPSQTVGITSYTDDVAAATGAFAGGTSTNDTSPTLNGTLSAALAGGELVNVYRDGVLVGTATVSGTSWTFTDSSLADGSTYSYTAQVVDAAGNVGSTSSPLTLTVDTQSPGQSVSIISYTDDVSASTGSFGSGTSTNDTSPTLNGTLSAALAGGEVVNVYRNGVLVGTATVSGTSWTFTDGGLANGSSYSYTAQVVDAAGNVGSTSSPLALTVDTSAPGQTVAITSYTDDVTAATGTFAGGTSTNDTSPTLNGTLSAALAGGETVNVYRDGILVGTATVSGTSWTFTDGGLVNGSSYSYTAQVVDAAGNVGSTSSPLTLTVDTQAPGQSVSIISYTDDVSASTGSFGSGTSTNDTSPTLNGTLSAALAGGEVVNVYRDGILVGTATVSGTSWTFTDSSLADGSTYSYTAQVVDAAGNVGSMSSPLTLTVDTMAPGQTVSITSYTDDVSASTGSFGSGTSTNDTSPTLNGTLSAALAGGEVVNVYRDGVLVGTATVSGTSWTFTDSGLADGSNYSYTAEVVDAAGNAGSTSSPLTLTVDTSAPGQTAAITSYTDNVAASTGAYASGTSTNDTSPTLNGTLSAVLVGGEVVNVYRDGVLVGTATVAGTSWTFTDSGLANGSTYSYTAQVVDAAGNVGSTSSPLTLTADTSAPGQTVAIASYTDDVAAATGAFASGTTTNDTSPTLDGTLSAVLAGGEVVNVYRDGILVGTATVSGTSWTFTDSGLANGSSYSYTAQVVDAAGNVGSTSGPLTLTVDTSAPGQTVAITSYTDDVAAATGTFAGGTSTNDTSPTLNGTLSAAPAGGEVVNVYRDGVLVGTATLTGTSWTFTDSGLTTGSTYSYTAQVVDAAGNVGSTSSPLTLTVDTSAPSQTVAITSYTDDVSAATGAFASGTTTNDTSPTLNGTLSTALAAGEVLNVYRDGVLIGAATVSGTSWSFADSGLADGNSYSYTAQIVDAAGNLGTASGPLTLSVDTSAPAQAVSIISYSDDVAVSTGAFASGTATNDTSPTLNGTLGAALAGGETVNVYRDGVLVGTATVSGTSWTFTDGGLVNGSSYSYTAQVVDAAGNVGSTSSPLTLTVDTSAPGQTVAITSYTDDVAASTGSFGSGTSTNDTSPTLNGTLSAALASGEVVNVYRDGVLVGTATVSGTSWTFTDSGLANGSSYSYTAQVVDAAGNVGSTSSPLTLAVDTMAPGQTVAITSYTDDVSASTGSFGSGTSTNDTSPTLNGTLSAVLAGGETVNVYRDGVLVGTATVSGTSWTFTDAGLVNGSSYSYTAQVVDAAGNVGSTSSPLTLTVDTSAPGQTVAITSYTDDVAAATGTFAGGTSTNDTSPTLNGTLSAVLAGGETVNVYRDGVLVGTATVSGTSWTFTDGGLVNGSSYNYTAEVVDAAGNVGSTSSPLTLTVDTSAPGQTVGITSYTDDVAAATGTFAGGTSTNDTSPTLNGTLGAALAGGELVNVYRDGVLVGTATVTGTSWTFTDSGLANGSSYSYTAQVVDAAGNVGSTSSPLTLTVDTLAPGQTVGITSYTDDVAAATGTFAGGTSTNDTSPTLNGTLSAALAGGETVNVYRDGVLVGTATVSGTSWTFTDSGLANGSSYSYTAQVVDAAGNVGSSSTPLSLTVDISAPGQTVAITSYTDDVAAATGTFAGGTSTNDTSPTLNGTLSAALAGGETVNVYRDGVLVGTATVSGTSWTFTDGGLVNGSSYSYTAQVVDAAGNVGSTSSPLTLTVDTQAPGQSVSILSYTDDVSASTGSFGSGTSTNDTSPTLNGTLSAVLAGGETVNVYRDGVLVGTATVSGTIWTFTDSGLANGSSYSYTAQVVDAAGNVGSTSSPLTLTVDTSAPGQTFDITSYTDDVAAATGTFANGTSTNDSSPTLNGTLSAALDAGEVLNVFRDGVLIGAATVSGTSWSFADSGLVHGSSYSYTAQIVDAAGNLGSTSSPFTLTVDTVAPTQTVSIISYTDDVAPSAGTFASGTITNDTTPTINGTLNAALAANEWVNVYRDGVLVGTATVSGTTWSFTDSGLADGSTYSYTAQVVDAAGNLGPASSALTLAVDTAAPLQTVSILAYTDDVVERTGTFGSGTTTNDTSPLLNGSLSAALDAGEVLNIYRDGVLLGTATVSGTTWTYADSGLTHRSGESQSLYTYTARVQDAAGNLGPAATNFTLSVDVSNPTQRTTIVSYTDDVAPNAGSFGSGTTTNDTTPVLSGTISASVGSDRLVTIYRDGVLIGTATRSGTNWTFADSGLVNGNTYTYTGRLIDAAGNLGPMSSAFTLTVDTTAPTQSATIDSFTDDAPTLTGTFSSGSLTNDSTPTLNGSLNAALGTGDVVAVFRDGTYVGNATTTGTSWSFTDSGLASGTYSYTARVQDGAGNAAGMSGAFTVVVDASAPTQSVTVDSYTDDVLEKVGTFGNNTTTNDTTPLLNGSLSAPLGAGEVLNVYRDGVLLGTATVNGTSWTYADSGVVHRSGESQSSYIYTVQVVDTAGNLGPISPNFKLTVDVSNPTQTITIANYSDDVSPNTGTFGSGTTTNDTSPTLSGTISDSVGSDRLVNIFRNGVLIAEVGHSNQAWTFTDSGLVDGTTYTYSARLVDAAGNLGPMSSSFTVTVDTSAPSKTSSITSYTDDVVANTGSFGSGTSTNDTTPTINGTLSSALASGEAVQVYRDGTLLGTATVSGTSWTYADAGLVHGSTYSYTTRVVDAAGNLGSASGAFTLSLDTSAPAQSVSVTSYTDDVGLATGTAGNGSFTDDTAPVINGSLSATLGSGEVVNVYRNGVLVGAAQVSGTSWSFADSGLSNGNSYSYTARVVDAAGNLGAASSAMTFTVDTVAPTKTVAVANYTDDVAPQTGNFASGTSTNDTAPVLNGSLSAALAPDEALYIFRNGTLLGAASVSGTSWTFAESGLTAGTTYSYTGRVADTAGNLGPASSTFSITVDTSAPAVLQLNVTGFSTDTAAGLVTGTGSTTNTATNSDRVTRDANPTLTGDYVGTLGPGENLQISADGGSTWQTISTSASWSYTDPTARQGTVTYLVRAADAAGNAANPSGTNSLTITFDTTAPVQSLSAPVLGSAFDTGTVGDGVTTTTAITFTSSQSGKAEAGATLALVDDVNGDGIYSQGIDNVLATTTVAADGTWSLSPTLAVGHYALAFLQVDAAGNRSRFSIPTELSVVSADRVVVSNQGWGSSGSSSNGGSAVTLSASGQWQFYNNQSVYSGNATSQSNFNSFSSVALASGGKEAGSVVFMDYNRDGNIDILTGDYVTSDGQLAWTNTGSGYTAFQVVGSGIGTNGSAAVNVTGGGIVALDKTGDGYVDLAYGDAAPGDSETGGGYDSQIVLNNAGSFIKDGSFVDTNTGSPAPTSTGNGQAHKEISAVDFDNNGTVDLVFHASAGSNLGSSNTRRLVYVSNQGNGSWSTTQVINDVFTLDSSTTTNTAVAMTWADFNGDGKMDLFLGAGRTGASDTQESRIFFTGGSTSPTMLGDSNPGGASVAVDWNHDGRMDVVELPSFSQTGQVLLQTNGGNGSSWTASNLLGGSNTTTGISGALAADYDWDGAVDLVYFPNAASSTQLARNTHTVATGTSLHLRIVDAQGLTAFYGNTVQLFNSSGNLVASQILNPQSGNESSDSSSIVHFYGLSATETYTAVLLRNAGGASADVGGLASLNGNTVENVNASWTGLVAGSATAAHVLTAEAGGNSANTIGTLVGTGYNDTFYATQGTDVINGAGGWSDRYGGSPAWSSSRGEDFIDFKLAGSTGVTVNLNTAGAQNTGFNTLTLANIEGLRGGAGNDNFTASTSAIDNIFEGRGGNDTFTLTNGGHTTLVYKLLDASDPTGGNGSDTSINFGQGNITSAATADVIHLGDLLSGYTGTANTYYDTATGLNVLDAASQGLNQFVKVTASAGTSYLYVDINGTGDFSASHLLLTMTGTGTVSLPYLLSTNQLLVSSTTALPITVNQVTTTDTTPLLTGSLPVALGDGELRITLNGKTYSSDVAGEISVASDQKTWSLTVPNADALGSGTYEVTARLVSTDGSLLGRDLTSGELTITASAQSGVGAATEAAKSGALLAVTVAEDSLLGVSAASDAVDLNLLPTSGGLINLGSGLTRSMRAQQQDLTLDDLIHPVPEPGTSVGAWLDNAPRADTLPPGQGAAAPPPPPAAQEAPAYDGTAHASPPASTSLQDAWTQLGISTI